MTVGDSEQLRPGEWAIAIRAAEGALRVRTLRDRESFGAGQYGHCWNYQCYWSF
ncbi:MAG: hypothetical protein EBE86_022805 [Hormoscilla sp. GUM202]|nr:hypothetical protein [Hormoscilla sp. GM7CHS1pb]MBO1350025.1 hypothetical protein [Hormoscilla sp. GUM202]